MMKGVLRIAYAGFQTGAVPPHRVKASALPRMGLRPTNGHDTKVG
jgi:hypothetical protein